MSRFANAFGPHRPEALVRSMVVYTPVLVAYFIGLYQLVWEQGLSTLEAALLVITGILA